MPARGTLYLVAGPSGAGKDTLINEARKRLAGTHVFVRRLVTRPAGDASEDHHPVSTEAYAAGQARGDYAFSWSAHGLQYAVPASIHEDLGRGLHVVVNVSRSVAASARQTCKPSRVILVTANRAILARRLAERGREQDAAIAARIDRSVELVPDTVIENEGALDEAVSRFIAALQG